MNQVYSDRYSEILAIVSIALALVPMPY